MSRVNISIRGVLSFDTSASIGIGSLIIFIAMIMVAGVTASVMIQTMNSLESQALKTASETIKDIANGVRVTHVSGYSNTSKITQLAIFIETTAGSDAVDLSHTYIALSDSSSNNLLNYDDTCFSSSVSSGIFSTINPSNLTNEEFGIIVIRDIDNSCGSTNPSINKDDMVAIIVNTTSCFSGLSTRTEVFGRVTPEYGIRGVIQFTTPGAYTKTIIDF